MLNVYRSYVFEDILLGEIEFNSRDLLDHKNEIYYEDNYPLYEVGAMVYAELGYFES